MQIHNLIQTNCYLMKIVENKLSNQIFLNPNLQIIILVIINIDLIHQKIIKKFKIILFLIQEILIKIV